MIRLALVSPPSMLPWKDEFLVIPVGFGLRRFMLRFDPNALFCASLSLIWPRVKV